MGFFEWIVLLFLLAMVNFAVGMREVKKFLDENRRISGAMDLSRFKDMVRKQMYQALLQIALHIGMGTLTVLGTLLGSISGVNFVLVMVLYGIVIYAGNQGKPLEKRARDLPVDDPQLQPEYRAVCRSWRTRAFPDF